MPNFPSMAAFNDAYNAADVSKKLDEKFQDLTDCESRSFWQIQAVK